MSTTHRSVSAAANVASPRANSAPIGYAGMYSKRRWSNQMSGNGPGASVPAQGAQPSKREGGDSVDATYTADGKLNFTPSRGKRGAAARAQSRAASHEPLQVVPLTKGLPGQRAIGVALGSNEMAYAGSVESLMQNLEEGPPIKPPWRLCRRGGHWWLPIGALSSCRRRS